MNNKILFLVICASIVFAGAVFTAEQFNIEHPIKNPQKFTDHERCDNCGMVLNEWARTRHEFDNSKGKFHTCSIHCAAVMKMKLQEQLKNVKVAEYLHPEKMLDADKAYYVIGSTAPGTMTVRSKIAFASEEEAEKFASRYGGTVAGFDEALAEAGKEAHDRQMHKHGSK